MNLNFDRLLKIYSTGNAEALYKEKQRLLQEFIDSLSEDKKQLAIDYDKKISDELVNLTGNNERLVKLSKIMQETLFDLTDAWLDYTSEMHGNKQVNNVLTKFKK